MNSSRNSVVHTDYPLRGRRADVTFSWRMSAGAEGAVITMTVELGGAHGWASLCNPWSEETEAYFYEVFCPEWWEGLKAEAVAELEWALEAAE